MILYNLFLFVSIRDLGYLYYVLFITGSSLFELLLNGFAFQYLWPTQIWWAHRSAAMLLGGFTCVGFLFTQHFLKTRENTPIINRIIYILIGLEVSITISAFFFGHSVTARLMVLGGFVFSLAAAFTGFRCLLIGYRPARFFVFAFSAYLFFGIIHALSRMEILPFIFVTEHGIQIGSAIQVILLSLGLADRINIMKHEKEEAQLELLQSRKIMLDSVSRFVPTQFLNFLGRESIIDIGLGDAVQKDFSVLFTDIRSFTTLSEKMSALENFKFLNSYLQKMGPLIHANNGFIDKFIGDAIMALFPKSPDEALTAAIAMRQDLSKYNVTRRERNYEVIEMGIGIHSGSLMLGTVGSKSRLDTTVIGDTVNLASRLESMTKTFKIPIMISDAVYNQMDSRENFFLT